MEELKEVKVTAPSYWASYLIDGDASGLEDNEQAECDAWVDRLFADNPGMYGPVDCEEIGFCRSCDAGTLAGDMCEYTFKSAMEFWNTYRKGTEPLS